MKRGPLIFLTLLAALLLSGASEAKASSQPTHYGWDAASRLTAITNANSEVVRLGYDPAGDITNLVDGLLHNTSWQYNQFGWLTNKVDALGRNTFRNAYNANGWLTNRITPEKGGTAYTYDNVGNLKSILYPQSSILFSYDALNRPTNMVDAIGNHNFGWTAIGLLASESDAWTTNTWSYAQGLRTAIAFSQPGGNWTQNYGRDTGWRMTNTVSPAGAFNYTYLSAFPYSPSSIALPNGAIITNSYDGLARLTGTALKNYWGHTLDGYTYAPDPLGLRTNILRNLGLTTNSVTVGYDNIAQITSWTAKESGGTLRQNEKLGFAYDAAHNLHSRTNSALVLTLVADAASQLTNVVRTNTFTLTGATPAPATNITVNGQTAQIYGDQTFAATNLTLVNGQNTFTNVAKFNYGIVTTNTVAVNLPQNVTINFDNNSSITNDSLLTYGYDTENQLTNITLAGQWKSDFVYDGLNRRRIERDYAWQSNSWVKTNEIRLIYDGYLLVQERDTNGSVLVTYTRGLDLSGSLNGAGGIGGLLARTDANGSTFYHASANGDITALMDSSENIVARYLYGPFGKPIGQWGPMAGVNEMQFSSMPTHRLSGIPHFPFRDFNPAVPTFLTTDPIGEIGGMPLHGFAKNNPVNLVDPLGLSPMAGSDVYIAATVAAQEGKDNNGVQQAVADQLQADNAAGTMAAGTLAATAVTAGIGLLAPEALPAWADYLWAAAAGSAGNYIGNGTENKLNGQPFNQNAGLASALGAGGGVVGRGIGGALNPPKECPVPPTPKPPTPKPPVKVDTTPPDTRIPIMGQPGKTIAYGDIPIDGWINGFGEYVPTDVMGYQGLFGLMNKDVIVSPPAPPIPLAPPPPPAPPQP